ncbi:HIT family protein [Weeksellaceae bacterium TAE3-ERU29]|nr:HIT family protein [Weeksellaceae bacterium TAE3-ERU29]
MASVFTKIVNGEIPAYKIAENDKFLAFLDVSPVAKGHTLVIPKKEVDRIWDLDKETYTELMAYAYDIAAGLEKAIPCNRVGIAVMGLEVPHAHVHLVPMNSLSDMDFTKERPSFSEEEMESIRANISNKIESK